MGFDPATLQFADPQLLWLLVVPALLLVIWANRLRIRVRDATRFAMAREIPRRERFARLGDAPFWLCFIAATALVVMALAQPKVVASFIRSGGADIVILLDGSASMHVADVQGNRWKRSIAFLRVLGDSLSWQSDRIALTLFAHIATPQIRLTRDPNTFFFFLDHLSGEPPFRLEDDSTWDTNIALGITWGLRLIEKDKQIKGPSPNAQLFVLMTDGQAWTGTVEESLKAARRANVPVYVIGVGTEAGGVIPDPTRSSFDTSAPITSRIDRASLRTIAAAGGGEYFEIDRGSDIELATRLIDDTRRRSATSKSDPVLQDVYWQFLAAAAVLAVVAALFLRDRSELWIQAAASTATLAAAGSLLR